MANHMRNLAMLATLILAGCGAMPNIGLPTVKERNDFKGQPLSAVTARLGYPNNQETINGQKNYYWRMGNDRARECKIKVVMAGDIVDSYETLGDAAICAPYDPAATR
jgi:hypothetical protein